MKITPRKSTNPINQPASRFTFHFPLFIILAFLLLPLTAVADDYWNNTGIGAWEDASNWSESVTPLPGENVNIANGGEARFTYDTLNYYYNQYGYSTPSFDTVSIADYSTLYLDQEINLSKLSVSNNSTFNFYRGNNYGQFSYLPQMTITGNSTVNFDLEVFKYSSIDEITGDGTGTFKVTGNGQAAPLYYLTWNNVNIYSEVDGSVAFSDISGISNVTVASGTFRGQDHRAGGNTTVASGATLQVSEYLIIEGGYSLGGGGTVEFLSSVFTYGISINVGGRLSTSITIDSRSTSYSGLSLDLGATLEFAEDSPLIILAENFEIATWGTVLVDFSDVSLVGENDYVIIDWSGVTNMDFYHGATSFSAVGTDVTGEFSIKGSQLVFTTDAVPEPSVYILLGIGLGVLLLTAHHRRRNQS
jgi:hypothetical protein